jgi:hypothetical protein
MTVLKRYALLFFGLVLLSPLAFAEQTLFDGYYRLTLSGKPIGYMISVVKYDDKKKTFETLSFLKTNKLGGDVQESTHGFSNNKFEPIKYSYTSKSGDKISTIDGSFKGEIMKLIKTDGKIKKTETYKNPKGTFLSSFLAYLMLQQGISVGKKFTYQAVAEEDGNNYNGEAWVKEKADFLGQECFRILNKFKGSEFISFMNQKGEVLGTTSPQNNIMAQLMKTPAEATKDFLVPNSTLKLLFGKVPTGQINALYGNENKEKKESSH